MGNDIYKRTAPPNWPTFVRNVIIKYACPRRLTVAYFRQRQGMQHCDMRGYLQRRTRPVCPHFAQAAVPRRFAENVEENALLARVYFGAWTLDQARSSTAVPYVGHLREEDETWETALRRWGPAFCRGQESKRHLGNFLSVYRIRPSAEAQENSDDSDADEALEVSNGQPPNRAPNLGTKPSRNKRTEPGGNQCYGIQTRGRHVATTTVCCSCLRSSHRLTKNIDVSKLKKTLRPTEASSASGPSKAEIRQVDATAQMATPTPTPDSVEAWAAQLPQSACNPEQKKFCRIVAKRVAAELRSELQSDATSGHDDEPLRWVLHGGAGHGQIAYH